MASAKEQTPNRRKYILNTPQGNFPCGVFNISIIQQVRVQYAVRQVVSAQLRRERPS